MSDEASFRLRIVSSNPNVTAADLVSQLLASIPELESEIHHLSPDYAAITISAKAEKDFPLEPATAYIILKVAAVAVGTGFFKKLGEDIYGVLKKKFKNGRIDPPT